MAPAEAPEAAPEGAGDARRKKSLHVVEAARGGARSRGFVQREESLPAQARGAGGRIVQQVGFGGQPQQNRHRDATTATACASQIFRQGIATL